MRKIHSLFTALTALLLVSCGGNGSYESKVEYIPFKSDKDNHWGLISPEGKVLFDDEFEECPTVVMNGRFFVEGKDGYELYAAEEKPKQVGGNVWKEVCDFTADVTPAVEKGKPIVLINRDGEVVKDMSRLNGKVVEKMQQFSEGYAVYKTTEGHYGLADTSGEAVIDAKYISLNAVSDGKLVGIDKKYEAAYKAGEQEKMKYAVLDTKGNVLAEIDGKKIKEVNGFYTDGLMEATVEKGEKTCAGLLDEKGEWVVEPSAKVRHIGQAKGKNFVFTDDDHKCGVMNFDGEVVVRAKYDGIIMLEEGIFAVYDSDKGSNESWWLIDADGEKIGNEKFHGFYAYGLGGSKYAIVEEDEDNYRFLGTDGEYLELEKGLDICAVRHNTAGFAVESDYVDMDGLAAAIGITREGVDGLNLGMSAEAAIRQGNAKDSTISTDPEDYAYRTEFSYTKDLGAASMPINIHFDERAGEAVTRTVTENYYGYTFSHEETVGYRFSATAKVNGVSGGIETSSDKLKGKGKSLYKAVAARLKALGKEIKSNDNAVVVSLGADRFGVAFFIGSGVIFGIVTGNGQDFDISQYANVKDVSEASSDSDYGYASDSDSIPDSSAVWEPVEEAVPAEEAADSAAW